MTERITQTWTGLATGRSCGTCTVCCTQLGIEELQKHACVTCKHLRPGVAPCSIYEQRPRACRDYECMWRGGIGPSWMKPSRSGLLMTSYQADETGEIVADGKFVSVTLVICDEEKARPYIKYAIAELLALPPVRAVNMVNYVKQAGLRFIGGKVYKFAVMPQRGYEDITFAMLDEPCGSYNRMEEPI